MSHTDGKQYKFCRRCGSHIPLESADSTACVKGYVKPVVGKHDYVPCPQNETR